jgi:two-component system sensor histidine kinase SenX3
MAIVGAGLLALATFLVALVFVFLAEDEARRAELDASRAALEAYASATVRRALDDEWRLGVALLDSAVDDPLLDDSRFVLVLDGVTVLPRRANGSGRGVAALTQALADRTHVEVVDEEDDPAVQRRGFVSTLHEALDANDRRALERSVRELLAHRRLHRLALKDDVSATLAMVEVLQQRSTPARVLLERVLREGFGPGEPGLQRQVLVAAPRLEAPEVVALCALVERQSRRAQVAVDDFVQRCRDLQQEAPLVPTTLMDDGLRVQRGFVVKGPNVRGVTVDLPARLAVEEQRMQERGLLGSDERLELSSLEGPVEALRVTVASPRWEAAASQRQRALGLGLGLVLLIIAVQRREQALIDAKAALVSTVSHELRTPLASLRVMAETLERKLEGVPQAKDWPGRIVGEVDGLTTLVENIPAFNRLEQRQDVLSLQRLSLSRLTDWLEADAGPDVQLSVRGLDDLEVNADPTWLRIAVLNLLRNARKYNERTPVTFDVVGRREGQLAVLEVTDNGIGTPRESWESVFEAFHRLRATRGRGGGGSGLGLALVRRVVEGHGGSVRVERSSSEGTTFRVELPGRFS